VRRLVYLGFHIDCWDEPVPTYMATIDGCTAIVKWSEGLELYSITKCPPNREGGRCADCMFHKTICGRFLTREQLRRLVYAE